MSAVKVAPARTRCRSKSPFGSCGLPAHPGSDLHAVPIGEDFWFAYRGGGRRAVRVGYGRFRSGEWCTCHPGCGHRTEGS